ncbi:MAG: class I SAM-dependent methyltransferase [Candidatus Bathyarchaeota archaeon]|nr:class I SAM-dependent methyltransferase [Candidatus Bathyarchaeota archaeon]
MSSDRRLQYIIIPKLKSAKRKSFLDIGCGFGLWGHQIRAYSNPSYLVGIDVWKPYLLKIKYKKIYDDLILADAINLPFKVKSINIILACEIIEHLPKYNGKIFLEALEKISTDKIIVSTPNFRYLQNELRKNPFEKHISFWKYLDFFKEYTIYGIGVQIKEKLFFSNIPFLGYFLKRLILFGVLCKFSELIVAIKNLRW